MREAPRGEGCPEVSFSISKKNRKTPKRLASASNQGKNKFFNQGLVGDASRDTQVEQWGQEANLYLSKKRDPVLLMTEKHTMGNQKRGKFNGVDPRDRIGRRKKNSKILIRAIRGSEGHISALNEKKKESLQIVAGLGKKQGEKSPGKKLEERGRPVIKKSKRRTFKSHNRTSSKLEGGKERTNKIDTRT